ELLVVIAIIALLISILLPALTKARESAYAVACAANLRSMAQAMQIYASENKNAIAGSPNATSRGLWQDRGATGYALVGGVTVNNVQGPIELFDFIYPLAKVMKVNVLQTNDAELKFYSYRDLKQFKCPSAEGIIAVGTGFTSGQ